MTYASINIQGSIISSEILEKIRTEDIRYQTARDFNLDQTDSVRDEISLAWSLALSHWNVFKQKREKLDATDTGTTETRNHWMKPLLNVLGYDLALDTAEEINGKSYAISFRATNLDKFPVHLVGINQSLDSKTATGGSSPHALVQEYLNNQEHLFALVSNGKFLRLLRDATRLSRVSYLEWNLEQMMEEALFAEFALLYRVLHASRMPKEKDSGAESIIEFYHQEALASGSRIRDRLSKAVETSIKALANGFLKHPANEQLRTAIANSNLTAKDYYTYNLRVIYRLLFLMVTEERNLVYPASRDAELEQKRNIYYSYYSVQRLSRLVEKAIYIDPRKTDLWQSLLTCFSLFEDKRYGNPLGIAPLGAGLFAPDALGVLHQQKLDNGSFLQLLKNLVTFENENRQTVRVNYADLDVEELGSVYEGLLELEPDIQKSDTSPEFLFRAGTGRKESGSHYTPEELVKPLIQHSLEYLIKDKLKEKDSEAGLLSLKVCDVACGSGHILLSAARRIGFELAKVRSNEEQPAPNVYRKAVRDAVNHCIYGVDKNPMAVELCKVAMWLEAHNPGEPLNFLDHHIKCGDAIVGLAHREELEKGIADEAFKALPGDEKEIASAFAKRNKQERKQMEQAAFAFDAAVTAEVQAIIEQYNLFKNLPERTPEEVANKEKQYRQYEQDYHHLRMRQLADAQVAQFFIPKTDAHKPYLLTDAEYRNFLRQVNRHMGVLQSPKLAKAETVAREKRFFHWFLEFPEVFSDGGFDCILGNPPFLGGSRISSNNDNFYLSAIQYRYSEMKGQADLVGYFFRRGYEIIKQNAFISLIATKTISQGDTRKGSLSPILFQKGEIIFAKRNLAWPGQAAVYISLVSVYKGNWSGKCILDNAEVNQITDSLDSTTGAYPFELLQNKNKSFLGSKPYGDGFIVSSTEANQLIKLNRRNSEVIFKYLNGQELNNCFNQEPGRLIINFFQNDLVYCRSTYPESLSLVETRVKPEREMIRIAKEEQGQYINSTDKKRIEKWWQYGDPTVRLYQEIEGLPRVLVVALTSKTVAFSFVPNKLVYSNAIVVIADPTIQMFSILQSSIHNIWVVRYTTPMKGDLRYLSSECFETFPFPEYINTEHEQELESIGEAYYEHRRQLMFSMQLGLTKTYNAFHAPQVTTDITTAALQVLDKKTIEKQYGKEVWNLWNHLQKTPGTCSMKEAVAGIVKLRELHVQMDNAVLEAYSWSDIQLRHDFYEVDYLPENDRIRYTIHPDARKEVLKRLLELNHKIHEEEVKAGLWDKKPARSAKAGGGKKGKKYKASEESNNTVEEGEVDYGLFKQE